MIEKVGGKPVVYLVADYGYSSYAAIIQTFVFAAYFTQRTSGLSLDVGLLKHPKLRAQPAKKPLAGRMVRKLRRILAPA